MAYLQLRGLGETQQQLVRSTDTNTRKTEINAAVEQFEESGDEAVRNKANQAKILNRLNSVSKWTDSGPSYDTWTNLYNRVKYRIDDAEKSRPQPARPNLIDSAPAVTNALPGIFSAFGGSGGSGGSQPENIPQADTNLPATSPDGDSWWTTAGSGVSAPGIIGAAGGAGVAAGGIMYHMQLDRARSRETIKRKQYQMVGTTAAGGAVSGASVGMMFGGPIGAIIGGLVGGAAGAGGGLFAGQELKKKNKKLQRKEQARTLAEAKAIAAEIKAEEAAEQAILAADRRKRNSIRSQAQVVLGLLRQFQPKLDAHAVGTAELFAEEVKDIAYASAEAEGQDLDILMAQLKEIIQNSQQLVNTPPAPPPPAEDTAVGGGWDLFGFSGMFDVVSVEELAGGAKTPPAPWPQNRWGTPQPGTPATRTTGGVAGCLPCGGLADYNEDVGAWLQATRNQNRASLGMPPIERSPGNSGSGGASGLSGTLLPLGALALIMLASR